MPVPTSTDPVATMLMSNIEEGVAAVSTANETLLAESETGTGIREIDKELKSFIATETNDVSGKDKDIVKTVTVLEKARAAFKKAQNDARNLYRVNILKEEEVTESENDIDVDAVKAQRKMVIEGLNFLKSYAEQHTLTEVLTWVNSLSVPQVGRQGASAVGQKKPRAFVKVNDTVYNTFGEAAKAASALLSTEDNTVTVSSGDLISSWVAVSEVENSFDFQGLEISVTPKPKGKDA